MFVVVSWAVRVVAVCVFGKDRQRYFGLRTGLLSFFGPVALLDFVLPFFRDRVDEPASAHIEHISSLAHNCLL